MKTIFEDLGKYQTIDHPEHVYPEGYVPGERLPDPEMIEEETVEILELNEKNIDEVMQNMPSFDSNSDVLKNGFIGELNDVVIAPDEMVTLSPTEEVASDMSHDIIE